MASTHSDKVTIFFAFVNHIHPQRDPVIESGHHPMRNKQLIFGVFMTIVLLGGGCTNQPPTNDKKLDAASEPSAISVPIDEKENAKSSDITGVVLYADTKVPVPGLSIVVGQSNIGTVTDTEGKFRLKQLLGERSQQIYIASDTFVVGEGTTTVSPGDDVTLLAYPNQETQEPANTQLLYATSIYEPSEVPEVRITVRDKTTRKALEGIPVVFERMVIQDCSSKKTTAEGVFTCSGFGRGVFRVYVPPQTAEEIVDVYQFSVTDGYRTSFELLY